MIKIDWKGGRKLSDALIRKARYGKQHPTASSVVNIFKKEDYITAPGLSSRCNLKPDAIPTIFENFPAHLKPKEHSFSRPGVKRKLPSPSSSPTKILRIHSYAKPPCDDIGYEGHNEGMVEDKEQRVHTEKLA